MPFTLTMPKLSPTMEEGTIAKWHKKEGEQINAGDLLFEVATDKATVEYTSLDDGWLRKIVIADGQNAVVNQPVAILTEEQNESIEGYQPEGVQSSQPSVELKATGPLKAIPEPKKEPSIQRVLASPLAKKLAKEQNLDLTNLVGSGPSQRIMSRDLGRAGSKQKNTPILPSGSFTTEALTPMRKAIAQRLQEAKSTIPHFYVQHSFNMGPLVEFREQLKELGQVVSVNDCIVRACALALKEHPAVNSGFDSQSKVLIRYQTVDIAVAVSIAGGLITPIIVNADTKLLPELSTEIRSLAKRAKEGRLNPDEYQGGSFTISNLGMYGITDFQAIINPPHAAILAVSGILDVPIVKNGVVVPGKMMNVTLSADHRVVDGVTTAEFLNSLKKYIENPVSLIFTKA